MSKTLLFAVLLALTSCNSAQNFNTAEEAKGLEVGVKAPLFEGKLQNGDNFKLREALEIGPVVVVFYRGQWCPYCNMHLSNLQDSLAMIYDLGAMVVAVSPQKPEASMKTIEKTGAEFSLLYDAGYKISDAFGVTFQASAFDRMTYNVFLGARLKSTQSDDSERLPIPATYIINQEGTVVWRQFDSNYKVRSTARDIIDQLTAL